MSAKSKSPEDLFRQVIVRVPPEMHAAIKARAAEEERTMSQTIRRAVRLYLESAEESA